MKKLIILTGIITILAGTTIFANNFDNTQPMRRNQTSATYFHHMREGEIFHSRCCNFDGRGRYQVQDKKFEANQLDIAEKRIALRREMLKDTPDWNKVEQLNKEIGAIRAENRTIMMKERAVNRNS